MEIIDRSDAAPLIPETHATEILQDAVSNSVVMSLATRANDMSSRTHRMPVLSALPSAYWVDGDSGRIPTSAAEWENVFLIAEKMGVIVPIPTDVLEDASYDIFGQVRPLIAQAIGRRFDRTVLHGEGAPASFPDDILTGAVAAGHTVDLSTVEATGDAYDAIMGVGGLLALVEADGFAPNGHVAALGMKAKLRGLRQKVYDGSNMVAVGSPLFQRSPDRRDIQSASVWELDGEPAYFPKNDVVPAEALMFSGDFSKIIWSVRKDMTYTVIREGVLQDLAGNIVYNLAQQDMVALRVTFRCAWALPNPVSLTNPNGATRYPFSVLVP